VSLWDLIGRNFPATSHSGGGATSTSVPLTLLGWSGSRFDAKEPITSVAVSSRNGLEPVMAERRKNTHARKTARKTPKARKSSGRRSPRAKPSSRRWSQRVTRESDALDLKQGVFKLTSARKIAASLKRSAERSSRRKAGAYRSALSMLTFYINRAGKTLPKTQRDRLDRAKTELKRQFGKD
jgi:hypothetical protein